MSDLEDKEMIDFFRSQPAKTRERFSQDEWEANVQENGGIPWELLDDFWELKARHYETRKTNKWWDSDGWMYEWAAILNKHGYDGWGRRRANND